MAGILVPALLLLLCRGWLGGSAPSYVSALDCSAPDLQALRAFAPHIASAYEFDDDYSPVSLEEAWSGSDCCSWEGVNCSSASYGGGPPCVSTLSLKIVSFSNLSFTSNFMQPLCNLSHLSTLSLEDTSEDTKPQFYTRLPACLGHLSALRHLSLQFFHLQGPLPSSFANLLNLQYLEMINLEGPVGTLLSGTLLPIANLPSLSHIDLSGCGFSGSLLPITHLPNLTYVDLSSCSFSGALPPFHTPFLQHLDLSDNSLSSTLLKFTLLSDVPSLTDLSLAGNALSGSIPPSISRLANLSSLSLGSNSLSGEIPQSFCKLERLTGLGLSYLDGLNTSLDSLECRFTNLVVLSLEGNKFTGPFPRWFGSSPSLTRLFISGNSFRGAIPDEWKTLQRLVDLDLSGNSLLPSSQHDPATLRLPDWFFRNPLSTLGLASCGLQTRDLSCSGKLSLFNQSLESLDLSDNDLTGRETLECLALHNFSRPMMSLSLSGNPLSINLSSGLFPPHVIGLELSSCKLTGVAPLLDNYLSFGFLDLSHNGLTMDLPSLLANIGHDCGLKSPFGNQPIKAGFDLSHNALVGEIPPSLGLCNKDVTIIRLDNNALVGPIPVELGSLEKLEILTLSNNHMAGAIPASIFGITSLALVDFSYNELEGNLNTLFSSLHNITYLRVVLLSHNHITGSIPSPFGAFMPDLQVIDFSNNNLTGTIPQKLHLPYLQSLEATNMELTSYPDSAQGKLFEDIQLVVKGVQLSYSYVLEAMTSLDFSCNFLEGEIPSEMGDLAQLLFLNLSHNKLSGPFPSALAKLYLLQALDVSSNRLAGPLPSDELSNLTKLSNFNVSFNAGLKGSIPQGPQFQSSESYKGDPQLCGSPALQDCKPGVTPVAPHTIAQPSPPHSAIAKWIDEWIALPGLSLGIVVGFGTTLFIMHFKR